MRFWLVSNNPRNKNLGLLTTKTVTVKLKITFWLQLCFSFRPRKAAKPEESMPRPPRDQTHWLTTPYPGTNQSVKTTTLTRTLTSLGTMINDISYMKPIPWKPSGAGSLSISTPGSGSGLPEYKPLLFCCKFLFLFHCALMHTKK